MKIRYFVILLVFAGFLSGCKERQISKKPFNSKVNIEDLMPEKFVSDTNNSAVGLYIYIFQFDQHNYPSAFQGLREANDLPVEYWKGSGSFAANGLISGGGDRDAWSKLAQVLTNAQAVLAKRTIAYMNFNTDEDIVIARLSRPVSVAYHSASDASAAIGLPLGTVSLRVNAPLTDLKQACKLSITPVYLPQTQSEVTPDETLKAPKNPAGQFAFNSAAINVTLRPGQFVFIAPDTGIPSGPLSTLGQMMFCSQQGSPIVTFCLIACGLIND
jgi:hypothetical protein